MFFMFLNYVCMFRLFFVFHYCCHRFSPNTSKNLVHQFKRWKKSEIISLSRGQLFFHPLFFNSFLPIPEASPHSVAANSICIKAETSFLLPRFIYFRIQLFVLLLKNKCQYQAYISTTLLRTSPVHDKILKDAHPICHHILLNSKRQKWIKKP